MSNISMLWKLCMLCILDIVLSFSPASLRSVCSITNGANNNRWRLNAASDGDEDWRAFRAKLVMSESDSSSSSPTDDVTNIDEDDDLDGFGALFKDTATTSFTPLDPEQWAYDSGKVIEKGAVILGGVEQDFGFGLRQQYFHKAVILVLDYDESTFTKGIILNRPSDRMMDDDVNDGLKWRVWFGGDVQGLDSMIPDIICLHSLKSEEAKEASVKVMKDIQWTSFDNAKKLVKKGVASGPDDFWLFAGYAGWGPRQLAGELDRKSWNMCATDSQTLLTELARQSKGVDVREAGLDVWELLMGMIGKEETANECSGSFDDYMLKEWSLANLAQSDNGEIGLTKSITGGMEISSGSVDQLMMDAAQLALSEGISAGALLRASSADRSPFLLTKQNLHHSLILVVLEDDNVSLACMLNHPANKGCDVTSSKKERSSIPIRYGGDYAIKGQGAMMWIHCSSKLRETGIGEPLGKECDIYKCTEEDAKSAISCGVANEHDFLITSGLMVWPKRLGGSLSDEVKQGTFEVVDSSKIKEVFQTLQKQEVLNKDNLERNLEISNEAWVKSARSDTSSSRDDKSTLTVGIGEGFDEDDESFVFNTDKKVSELSKEAQIKWVATFLLGEPSLK